MLGCHLLGFWDYVQGVHKVATKWNCHTSYKYRPFHIIFLTGENSRSCAYKKHFLIDEILLYGLVVSIFFRIQTPRYQMTLVTPSLNLFGTLSPWSILMQFSQDIKKILASQRRFLDIFCLFWYQTDCFGLDTKTAFSGRKGKNYAMLFAGISRPTSGADFYEYPDKSPIVIVSHVR